MGEVQDCCQLSNSACLQLGPHVCEQLSWRRIQAGVPESDSEASSKLLKIMIWCCMFHSEVGHCRWNCQCDQMRWYTAEVRGDRSIPLGLDPIRSVYRMTVSQVIVPNWSPTGSARTRPGC